MDIKVVNSDLIKTESEAMIVPAGTALNMTSTVASDIRGACDGPVYKRLQQFRTPEEGDVCVTDGFNLSSYLFHTVTTPEHRTRAQNVRMAFSEALSLAEQLGCGSLATPIIGSGWGGVDSTAAVKIIGETVDAHTPTHLSEVQLACVNQDTYQTAQTICSRDQLAWVGR